MHIQYLNTHAKGLKFDLKSFKAEFIMYFNRQACGFNK